MAFFKKHIMTGAYGTNTFEAEEIQNYDFYLHARTQSQLCTATSISSFVQCPISFWLLPSSVVTFILIEIHIDVTKKLEQFSRPSEPHICLCRSD